MEDEQAYLEQLNSNFDLEIKLAQKKICKLGREIEACEQYIFYLEKNLVSWEDEIEQLKVECQSTLHELKKCWDHLELKEEALIAQDERIIRLETTVEKLKIRIQVLSTSSKSMADQRDAPNSIQQILIYRLRVFNCLTDIRIFFDQIGVPIDPIVNHFNDATGSLDAIIQHANTLQTIGVDQNNQIEGFAVLLDEANERIKNLE
jgi:chromosome segregation ATPase